MEEEKTVKFDVTQALGAECSCWKRHNQEANMLAPIWDFIGGLIIEADKAKGLISAL